MTGTTRRKRQAERNRVMSEGYHSEAALEGCESLHGTRFRLTQGDQCGPIIGPPCEVS